MRLRTKHTQKPKQLPPFEWPIITKRIESAVVKQLHENISIYDKSGVFADFENLFAAYHKRRFALLCNAGTMAIHSMFVAARLQPGDEVICPAYTFFATVTPLFHTGARPILCDCDENGNIDPEEIKKKITPETKAVIVTHMWGIPCQMDKITALCKKHKLILLEDCSHAHGARFKGKLVGTFGDMAAWSLQGAKIISGGEGGILLTDNQELFERALVLGHYNKRCKQELHPSSAFYPFATTGMGLKYRAHPLAIAVAYELLKDMERILQVKREFAQRITNGLKGIRFLRLPNLSETTQPSWYAYVFQYAPAHQNLSDIKLFYAELQQAGLTDIDRPLSTSPLNLLPLFQKPATLFPQYTKCPFHYKAGDFPRAEAFYHSALKIPVWGHANDRWIMEEYIKRIKAVADAFQKT